MRILYLILSCCALALQADASLKVHNTTISLIKGDITTITGYDALVNAANVYLSHGGGVAFALSQAAGPQLQKYSFAMPSLGLSMAEKVRVGQAVVTPAFDLQKNGVRWIIHAVGPQIPAGKKPTASDEQLLYDAYFNSLLQAKAIGARRVALPSISTNIFGYDIVLATPIAKRAVIDFINQNQNVLEIVTFVLFTHEDYHVFENVFLSHNAHNSSDKTFWQTITEFVRTLFGWQ